MSCESEFPEIAYRMEKPNANFFHTSSDRWSPKGPENNSIQSITIAHNSVEEFNKMQTRVGYKNLLYFHWYSVYIRQQSFCSGQRWEGKWLAVANTTLHWNTNVTQMTFLFPLLPCSPLGSEIQCPDYQCHRSNWPGGCHVLLRGGSGELQGECVTLVRIQPQHWTTTLRLPVFRRLGGLAARGHPDNINNSEPCHHEEQSGGNCRYGDEDVAVEN